MVVPSSIRSRLAPAARWLAPSVVAACAGATAAGLVEGLDGGPLVAAATTGFVALVLVPVLFALGVAVRATWAAWQPRAIVQLVIEDGGGAPQLAGWIAVIWLSLVAIAWAAFQGVWWLVAQTTFKPVVVAFVEPVLVALCLLAIVVLSRPAARLFTGIARAVDARWRRNGRGTLLRPRTIFATSITAGVGLTGVVWFFVVKPRIGPVDLGVALGPVCAMAAVLAIHGVWARLGRARLIVGGALGVIAAGSIAVAGVAVFTDPDLTLEIWGDRPVAGLAIDRLFDLDSIRARISLAEFRPADRPGAEHPDIILVTIDTVRADHTPPYGGQAEMPVLRELATRGSVFVHAFSPSNVTRRSIPSLVIGLQPNRVHGRVVGWALRVDPRHVLLAERMQAAGYDTAGFMCCRGFWDPEVHTGLQRGLEHLEIEPNGTLLAKRARAWLDARERGPNHRPLFLWMHILEPHNWTTGYGEPRNDDERRKYYDHALAQSDTMLFQLLGAFSQRPPDHAPIVIVTADHGEALGEHGQPYHSTDLYDSQIRVPLVMAGPGIHVQRVQETVSLNDLVPTIVELAGFEPPSGNSIDGRSIAGLATGKQVPDADAGIAFAAMIKDRSNPGGITAVVKGKWKLIQNGPGFELYDIHTDPDERANVASQHPKELKELKQLLEAKQAAGNKSPF